jgi:hypothetical protein
VIERLKKPVKKDPSAENNHRRPRKKLTYVKSVSEIPDFRSDDEIAAWYQTHSTVLVQDEMDSEGAAVGGQLRSRLKNRRSASNKPGQSTRSAR